MNLFVLSPIGVKDVPVKSRSAVRTTVYPEKPKLLSLTNVESLFSPSVSLIRICVSVGRLEDSPVFFNSPSVITNSLTFTESEEFDEESALKMKLLFSEFKEGKS